MEASAKYFQERVDELEDAQEDLLRLAMRLSVHLTDKHPAIVALATADRELTAASSALVAEVDARKGK